MGSLGNVPDWFVAPRYCEHGKVIDDYCEQCESEEMAESEENSKSKAT